MTKKQLKEELERELRKQFRRVNDKLDVLYAYIKDIRKKEIIIMVELDDLEVAVNENTTLDGSIIALVEGLATQIEALKANPAKLISLAASLREKSLAIAAAIQANTPVVPPPVE